jgi:autotransporter adhesin
MNAGTTFTADNLVASTIAATSITASNVVATTLSVTGNTTLGGTLNMSGNRITNVADGVNPTDAVNLRQLQQSQRESRAGIASVAAIAGIPTLSTTDDAVLGVGVGTFKGESSIAVGASKRFSDSTAIKFGVGANSSTGDVTGSFGIGIKW